MPLAPLGFALSGKEQWSSQVSANGPSPAICAAGLRKLVLLPRLKKKRIYLPHLDERRTLRCSSDTGHPLAPVGLRGRGPRCLPNQQVDVTLTNASLQLVSALASFNICPLPLFLPRCSSCAYYCANAMRNGVVQMSFDPASVIPSSTEV